MRHGLTIAQGEQTWRGVHYPSRLSPAGFETLGPETAVAGLGRCDTVLAEIGQNRDRRTTKSPTR